MIFESIYFKLFLALVLGILLGYERAKAGKIVGMRTYALVTIAATLFVATGFEVSESFLAAGYDVAPFRIAASVVSGVGFLGAGLMIFHGKRVYNVTTAATMWMSAAIGVAIGTGLYLEATVATLLVLFILNRLNPLESNVSTNPYIKKRKRRL